MHCIHISTPTTSMTFTNTRFKFIYFEWMNKFVTMFYFYFVFWLAYKELISLRPFRIVQFWLPHHCPPLPLFCHLCSLTLPTHDLKASLVPFYGRLFSSLTSTHTTPSKCTLRKVSGWHLAVLRIFSSLCILDIDPLYTTHLSPLRYSPTL